MLDLIVRPSNQPFNRPANPGFMCGRENTRVPSLDLFFIQISWAGGKVSATRYHHRRAEDIHNT